MVKRCIDQKLRLRNFDARHGKIESGAVERSRKGIIGVEGGEGICYQWKEKGQCSQPDQSTFWHESNDRAQKPTQTPHSRESNVRTWQNGNHGSILRQPCRYYLRGTCTRTPGEHWHPPECQVCKNETGCKAGDKCLFPHHKVDEQRNKKPKKSNIPKRRENDDKNAVAVVETAPQLGCVSQDSEALVSHGGKQARRNPMQKVLESIQVCAAPSEYQGKERTIAWEK